LAIIFGAHAVQAQSIPSPPAVIPTVPLTCKGSTLTGPSFLNLLTAIIKHGDLTDNAFLRRILGTKFSLSYGYGPRGAPSDRQVLEFDSYHVLGNPIHVHLVVHLDVVEGKPSNFDRSIAWIRFEGIPMARGDYIGACMQLKATNLESYYESYYPHGLNAGGESTRRSIPGKDNTKFYIGWFYSAGGLVNTIEMSQIK
jgi:hypothetical protein